MKIRYRDPVANRILLRAIACALEDRMEQKYPGAIVPGSVVVDRDPFGVLSFRATQRGAIEAVQIWGEVPT